MKILICGSRHHCDKEKVFQVIHQHLSQHPGAEVICGDALGVDAWVVEYAVSHRLPVTVYATSENFRNLGGGYAEKVQKVVVPGNYAFRDEHMVELADLIICIWNGSSPGTKYVYDYALARGKKTILKSGRV